jgi:excinuclease ABC subunit C
VDRAWYASQVRAVELFIEGRHDELSRELEDRMADAARTLRFELAAVYRDQLRAIELVREEQRVVSVDARDRDVLGLYREGELVELALLHVRAGKLADVSTFSLKGTELPDAEVVSGFLLSCYGDDDGGGAVVPEEILVPVEPDVSLGIEEWLEELGARRGRRRKVRLVVPKRGPRAELLALAVDNARHAFLEKSRTSDDVLDRLAQLQEKLRLAAPPRRIECVDISHLGGGDTVGAVVAMTDGQLDKKRYRTFHLRGLAGAAGGDDYAAMYEVLARRFRRARPQPAPKTGAEEARPLAAAEGEGGWELPDLVVVDGGRGQLAVALAAARDLGLHALPIVGLAKERENARGEELVDRVYLPGQKNPVPLRSTSTALFFLARLRDEAHRFSNKARERLGKARRLRSALDDVPGIGPALKKALLTKLGSVAAIARATDDELLAVRGVQRRHVEALRRSLAAPRS